MESSHIARVNEAIIVVIFDELAVRAARDHCGEGNALRAAKFDVVFERGAEAAFDSDD